MFTSQSAAAFYDKLFSSLDFSLPKAATGRRGFPKEAMVCAFIVMKCEFSQITDLADYLDNNRLIAHYCGFNIMEPLPSYWTYDRFLRQLDNVELKACYGGSGTAAVRIGDRGRLLRWSGFHARHGKHQTEQSQSLCKEQVFQGKPPEK